MAIDFPNSPTNGDTYTVGDTTWVYQNSVWNILTSSAAYSICTSSSRPSAPGEGRMIYETDTDKVLVYSGSAWIEITDITNAASNIMQRNVQSTTLASTLTLSSAAADTYYDATGLSVNITPTSSSSKILVMVDLSASMAGGADARAFFRLVRDSTAVGGGTASGNRPSASKGFYEGNSVTVENSISWTYLDSPNTTSSVTYKIQYAKSSTALVMYLNRTGGDPDLASQPRTSSTITVMEIPV